MINMYSDFISFFNNMSEESISEFTMKRLQILEESFPSEQEEKGIGLERIYKGYINSDTPIKTSNMVVPFHIDHADLYMEFLRFLKQKDQLQNGYSIIYHVQEFMGKIFGNYGLENNRVGVYLKHYDDYDSGKTEKSNLSISEFYENNSALCIERSAVVQNLLSFMGISSYMVCGKLQTDSGTEAHAYIIFQSKGDRYVLYDPTNPAELINEKGQLFISPAFMTLNFKPMNNILFNYDQLQSYLNSSLKLENKDSRKYVIPYELDMPYTEYKGKSL